MADWFLEEVVDWTWNTYHKPIWITEFSTTGASITATGGNGTKEFWERVMPGLDSREYVERYAAFDFNSPSTGLWLYGTGELTPAGEVYRDQGNPEGYAIAPEVEPDFTYSFSKRNTLLQDSVTVNSVTCEDYVNADGVTATATSANNANSDGDKAIDGDITSRWESKHGNEPQSLTIDLGQIRNIKQIGIIWEAASAKDYKIEVSSDGVNFTQAALVEDGNGDQNRFDTIKLKEMVEARYVRINCINRTTNYGYSIFDVAIYGTDNKKVDETTTKAPTTTVCTTEETVSTMNKNNVKLAKAKVKSATKKKADKKVKIILKKIKGAQKYQIQISKSKNFKKKLVKKTVKKVKFTLKSKKIKNKKKLYVRARAMCVVNKKKYYGKWSKAKKIKIKK